MHTVIRSLKKGLTMMIKTNKIKKVGQKWAGSFRPHQLNFLAGAIFVRNCSHKSIMFEHALFN